jgi:ParB-like chromosome segregation protein Spo0J
LDHLTDLINKFGLIDKPIINTDFTIIGGHQRIRILKKQKEKIVECWMPDRLLTDKEVENLMIGLNKNQGTWDYDLLSSHYDVIDLLEYGFSEKELLGTCVDEEDPKEKESKEKKLKMCPSCGHEF